MVGAHCAISLAPISVEPVKVSMRTIGLEVSSLPITLALPVMTLNTPLGMPARSASTASASAVSGVSEAGLHTTVQPTASAGADLARDHGGGEVPRRDGRHHADRLLDDDDARIGLEGRDGLAVDALGLLGEELDEAGGVEDLALGLGQRLALLVGEQQRQLVGVLDHQVEPAAHELGALLGQHLRPGRQRAVGGLDGGARLGLAEARHPGDDVAGRLVGDGQLGSPTHWPST